MPFSVLEQYNNHVTCMKGEIPSGNGMASARDMAKLGAMVVAGGTSEDGEVLFSQVGPLSGAAY